MRFRNALAAAGLAGAAVAVGYAAMKSPSGADADAELFRAVNAGHGPSADRYFAGITELGSLYAAGTAAGSLAALGRRRAAVSAAAAAGATWLVGQGIKRLVDRPRPYVADPQGTRTLIAEPAATSWPSSHPAVLTTFTRVAARELRLGAPRRPR